MTQKTILVTGSNKGIGFEIIKQLSGLGHQVFLTSRDEDKGQKAVQQLRNEKLEVFFTPLDITNELSLDKCFHNIKNEFGKLDVLINNAAIVLKEDRSLLKNANEVTLQTLHNNAFAQLSVVRKFLPLIPRSGRIIMTSSQGGSMSDPVGGWSPAYCISKSLLNAMTRHLAYELSHQEITVNAYCPGWVHTDMGGRSAPRTLEQGADTAVWLVNSEKVPTGKFFYDRKEIPW